MPTEFDISDIRALAAPFGQYIDIFGHRAFINFNLNQLNNTLEPVAIDVFIPKIGLAIILDAQKPTRHYYSLSGIFNHIILVRKSEFLDNKPTPNVRELEIRDCSRYEVENCLIKILTYIHSESRPVDFKAFNTVIQLIAKDGIRDLITYPKAYDTQKAHMYELSRRTMKEVNDIIQNDPKVLYGIRGGHLHLPCALWDRIITNSVGTNFNAVIEYLFEENCVVKRSHPSHVEGEMHRCHILRITDLNKLFETEFFL